MQASTGCCLAGSQLGLTEVSVADSCSLASQVLGLYPAKESPALSDAEGQQLALHAKWQQPGAGAELGAPSLAVSLGQVFAACVPDLATRVLETFRAAAPAASADRASAEAQPVGSQHDGQAQQQGAATAGPRAAAPAGGQRDSQAERQGTVREPPAWLSGGADVVCSVVLLQLAALSGAGSQRAAAVAALSVPRCSARLGPLRAPAWQGGLLEGLLSMLAGAPAGSGLHADIVGARLGIATAWCAAGSRREALNMGNAGVREVCEPFQVEGTVALASAAQEASMLAALAEVEGERSSAAGPPATSSAGGSGDAPRQVSTGHAVTGSSGLAAEVPHAWDARVSASPVELRVGCAEVAALACAAGGLSAVSSRGSSQLLPPPGVPSAAVPDGTATWLLRLSVDNPSLCALWRPARASEAAASLSSASASCSTLPAPTGVTADVQAKAVSVALFGPGRPPTACPLAGI